MNHEYHPDSIARQLHDALQALNPIELHIHNESANHAGYYPGKETHFKMTIVSTNFIGKSRVARHQCVYRCVHDLLGIHGGQIHALAVHAYTPEQWETMDSIPPSPDCAGHRS